MWFVPLSGISLPLCIYVATIASVLIPLILTLSSTSSTFSMCETSTLSLLMIKRHFSFSFSVNNCNHGLWSQQHRSDNGSFDTKHAGWRFDGIIRRDFILDLRYYDGLHAISLIACRYHVVIVVVDTAAMFYFLVVLSSWHSDTLDVSFLRLFSGFGFIQSGLIDLWWIDVMPKAP